MKNLNLKLLVIGALLLGCEKSSIFEEMGPVGILASVGYEYKKISLELFSYYGLSQIKEGTFTLNHKPFFSIGASISYLFWLNLKGNGKKVICPKV